MSLTWFFLPQTPKREPTVARWFVNLRSKRSEQEYPVVKVHAKRAPEEVG